MHMSQHYVASASLWRRYGCWGLLFFLVKGLAWLIVPALTAWFGMR